MFMKISVFPILLSVAMVGCTTTKSPKSQHTEAQQEKPAIRNKNCANNIKRIEVINTLDRTHALVHYYTKDDEKRPRIGLFANYANNILLYDELNIKVPSDHCAVIKDTFTYENKEIGKKTGPVIVFEYKYLAKNKQEAKHQIRQTFNNVKRNVCNTDSKEMRYNYKDVRQCRCYLDTRYNNIISLGEELIQRQEEISKMQQSARTKAVKEMLKSHIDNTTKYLEEKCGAMKNSKTPRKPVTQTVMLDGKPVKVTYRLEWFLNFGWYEKSPNNSGK